MKRAQSSVELILIVCILMGIALGALYFFQPKLESHKEDVLQADLNEISQALDNEIGLALKSSEGYTRQFDIPTTIQGNPYTIDLLSDTVSSIFIRCLDKETELVIASMVEGTVVLNSEIPSATITIKKSADRISINSN